jgi:hypothetical protein
MLAAAPANPRVADSPHHIIFPPVLLIMKIMPQMIAQISATARPHDSSNGCSQKKGCAAKKEGPV